jgi:hypothetical protein
MGEDHAAFAFFKDVGDVSLFKPYIRYYIRLFLSRFFYHCIAAAVTIDLRRPRTLEMETGPRFATLVKRIRE